MEIYRKILAYKTFRVVICVQTDGQIDRERQRL